MPELLHLITLEADTPVESMLLRLLMKQGVKFDAQANLLDNFVSYSVKNAEDLPKAKELLYRVLHPTNGDQR